MKSLFLYQNTIFDINMPKLSGIYQLNNNIVGIDTKVFNKRQRRDFVSLYNLREFHFLQKWFGNIIKNAASLQIDVMDVKLSSESIEEDALRQIENLLIKKEYYTLINTLKQFCDDYECDIERIKLGCKGCMFNIISSGVLESEANDDEFEECVHECSYFLTLSTEAGMRDINEYC